MKIQGMTNFSVFVLLADLYQEEIAISGSVPNRIYSIPNWTYVEACNELHHYRTGNAALHVAWRQDLELTTDPQGITEILKRIVEAHVS